MSGNKQSSVETIAAEYVETFLATGMAYEFTAESIAHRSFIDGYTAGSREVGQLKAALALGQENCDAEYDTLREERDEARAELARVEAQDASARIEGEAEIARLVAQVATTTTERDHFVGVNKMVEAELARVTAERDGMKYECNCYHEMCSRLWKVAGDKRDGTCDQIVIAELAALRRRSTSWAKAARKWRDKYMRTLLSNDAALRIVLDENATIRAESGSRLQAAINQRLRAEKAEAELAALRRDKARLDWLDKKLRWWAPGRHVDGYEPLSRDAIDAAMNGGANG